MEADDGDRLLQANRRVRRLTVIVCVQHVLLLVCLMLTFYLCWDFHNLVSDDIAHIRFDPIQPISGHNRWEVVKFIDIGSSYKMDLNEQKDQISISCTGFYLWHMHVCFKGLKGSSREEASGQLRLLVQETSSPVASFTLNATEERVCRGIHRIIHLADKQLASLQLNTNKEFKITNITMGLSSLQGKQCVT